MDQNNRKKTSASSRKKTTKQPSRPGTRSGSSTASQVKKSSAGKSSGGRVVRNAYPQKKKKGTSPNITVKKGRQNRAETQHTAARSAKPSSSAADSARRRQIHNSQRKRRRKYKHNYTVYYLMLAILLTATGIALSLTVFFRIETIDISGSNTYTDQQIGQFLQAKAGDNLLRYNAEKEADSLLSILSRADSVTVKKKFPNTLLIEVTDGVPMTQFYNAGTYYYVSEKGRVLYSGGDPLPQITVYLGLSGDFSVGGYLTDILSEEDLAKFTEFSAAVNSNLPGVITLVDIAELVDIRLCYQNRIQVDLGSMAELEEKLSMLRETMASGEIEDTETGVIDLNQANMLVFNSASSMDEEMDLAADWQ